MTNQPRSDVVEDGVRRALARLEASRDRVYYDAQADASPRAAYYAGVDADSSPPQLFETLGTLLETTHRPRPAYPPGEPPWVDLHSDRRLRSVAQADLDFRPLDTAAPGQVQSDAVLDPAARADGHFARRETRAPAALWHRPTRQSSSRS